MGHGSWEELNDYINSEYYQKKLDKFRLPATPEEALNRLLSGEQ